MITSFPGHLGMRLWHDMIHRLWHDNLLPRPPGNEAMARYNTQVMASFLRLPENEAMIQRWTGAWERG